MLYLPLNNDERFVRWSVAVPAESFLADPKGAHAYLVGITLRACQIARSAAANAAEAVGTNVPDLYEAVENCEKELDQLDRELDQRICAALEDRKSTRLNSSHVEISYAVFCLKKKKKKINRS